MRILLFVSLMVAAVSAQMTALSTSGGRTAGAWAGVSPEGAPMLKAGESAVALPLKSLVVIAGDPTPLAPVAGSLRFELRDGGRIVGRIAKGGDEDVEIVAVAAGTLRLAIDDVRIVRNPSISDSGRPLPDVGDRDGLFVDRDGRIDALPGELVSLGSDGVVFSSAAGSKRTFAWSKDRVAAVAVSGEAPSKSAIGRTEIALRDGSRLYGTLVPGVRGTVRVALGGGREADFDASAVASLTFAGGDFRHLSDMPFRVVDRPLLATELPRAVRRDAGSAPGAPLRSGRATFTKGVSIPVDTDLVIPLDGRAGAFRAEVGAEVGTRSGTPGVRVSLVVGGRSVASTPWLRPGDEPVVFAVEGLSSATEATLRVEAASPAGSGTRVVVGNAWFSP
jgi:NPCBM/NEW2 domain